MEVQLINEFVNRTGASPGDAMSCLTTWGFDLKRALTDYNDTSTNDYLNNIVQGDIHHSAAADRTSLAAHNPLYSELPLTMPSPPTTTPGKHDAAVDTKKLERGISRAIENANLVSRARNEMAIDFQANALVDVESSNLCAPYFTFTVPDLTIYSDVFRKFIEKDLIENSTLVALESSNRLNWWANSYICRKLWPLSTTGDGNCLLHAASLGMWGFHDRKLTLRTALHNLLSHGEYRDALWRRWRFQQTKLNKQAGFVYSDFEWAKEWDEIVVMASTEPRQSTDAASVHSASSRRRSFVIDPRAGDTGSAKGGNVTYESLEEIHILALAHVLRRTIIVVADTMLRDMNGEAMAPITFGGMYLPFGVPSEECHRSPLLLTYDTAHFSALVPMDTQSDFPPSLIPLVDFENKLLPVHFCIDPGESFDWRSYDGNDDVWSLSDTEHISLLREYLNVINALNPSSPDDEIYEDYLTDEEGEAKRQFADSEVVLSDDPESEREGSKFGGCVGGDGRGGGGNKKATKQLQNVAKQFGSIGKNMSKKIRKNFGNITSNFKHGTQQNSSGGGVVGKKGSGSSGGSQKSGGSISKYCKVLCAELKTKRHGYQQEMIRNYLECAQMRFKEIHGEDVQIVKEDGGVEGVTSELASLVQPQTVALTNTPISLSDSIVNCINSGCPQWGTSTTSYMCEECFERQKRQEEEAKFNEAMSAPRYGTGNSKFYTQTDMAAHKQIQNLPPVRRLHELDQTLYLSNSTFFNDKLPGKSNPVKSSPSSASSQSKVINHRIMVEGQDYNRPLLVGQQQQGVRPVPPPRKESQRNAIYFGQNDDSSGSSPDPIASAIYPSVLESRPCKTAGCSFFGNSSTNNYCSKCRQSYSQPAKILTDV